MGYSNEDWRRIDHAVEANRSLRSFKIIKYHDSSGTPPPTSFIDHLCTNDTLKNIKYRVQGACSGESKASHSMCICVRFILKWNQSFTDISDNSLKSLLVPREKCSVRMRLTPRQWCAVLSGLKDAKTLKKLDIDMSQVRL